LGDLEVKREKMNTRKIAEQIFLAGVDRVLPDRLIGNSMSLRDNYLYINNSSFSLDKVNNIYVIGAGKASALMGAEVERILEDRITEGHIVVKYGHSCSLKKIVVTEAGHPVPDSNGFDATRSILGIALKANSNDLVICLLSGGGSALLADFPEGSSPEEMMIVTNLLVKCGSSINEINTVRKHLSDVKGGRLARAVFPASLVTLILSDVIGDPLDVIASGPTVPDPTTYKQALEIIQKYRIAGSVPRNLLNILNDGAAGKKPETPKPEDHIFEKTSNILIGNNKIALEAARKKSIELNIKAEIITDRLDGDISAVSENIVAAALRYRSDAYVSKPVCLLFGGEPTVKVTGRGQGGRNQHLALTCAELLKNKEGITILSAGTDGNDGPTSAAGAVVDCNTYDDAEALNIRPDDYLREFDSFSFFEKAGGHINTGPTMTNVMDIIVVIVN
jgi:glycerate 2-kinase